MRHKQYGSMLLMLAIIAVLTGITVQAQRPQKGAAARVGQPGDVTSLARQAQDAITRGDWPAAIRDFEKLTKAAPAIAEFHLNLGIAYYSSGQPADAVPELRQALKLKPALTQSRYFLGAALAEVGQCQEALTLTKKDAASIPNKELRRTVDLAGARCSMKLNQPDDAVEFIRRLNRDFPDDPEVLYLTVHVYSDLSIRAAQGLLIRAPSSYQVRLLNAEALETQGNWGDAAAEYRQVLTMNPRLAGIHYRLGRLLLSAPDPPPNALANARTEFDEELKIDPNNAGAAYIIGELARRDRKWSEAIEYFGRAAKLDPLFVDAFIGLGRSLVANRQFAEAVPALETAVKLQPENPAGHYHLGIAYSRVGRKVEAERESATFREISEKSRQTKQDIQTGILGPQKAEP